MLLPGLAAVTATRAEEAPTEGVIALKYGWYRDRQPGLRRVTVESPHLYLLAPIAGQWSLEATRVGDSLSGATPRIHTFKSSASVMADHRDASDVKVTRYFRRGALAVGAAYSDENDYLSRSVSVDGRWASEDNNTTFNGGMAATSDRIDTSTTGGNAFDERKRVREYIFGVTQVLTPDDVAQVQYTRSIGSGYYTDPYKDFDDRPRARRSHILLARWNHHIESRDATVRASWRWYSDSFGIRSHTLGAEWVQPAGAWTFKPALRYYTQGAAWFYFDPVPALPGQSESLQTRLFGGSISGYKSADHRLAAYGALTLSFKVAWAYSAQSSVDLKLEHYHQSTGLRGSGGSPGLDRMTANFVQLGWAAKF
ncbi:MAG: DUF3570 domain-containing protein [Burkholderiales bacterium]|nr:DUF3570 domain-containing protein [Burkholderiales bacterium]